MSALWWTEDQDTLLRRLWAVGETARTISDRIGKSRNSVIGRAHRLHLARRKPSPPPRRKPTWTAEQDERLRSLHAAGWSQRQIAAAMGCGVTTIVRHGRALKLPFDMAPKRVIRKGPKPMQPKPYVPQITDILPPTCAPVTLMDRTNRQCSWIDGEPVANALMCGAPTEEGESFCPYHSAKAQSQERKAWSPERRARFMRSMGLGRVISPSMEGAE